MLLGGHHLFSKVSYLMRLFFIINVCVHSHGIDFFESILSKCSELREEPGIYGQREAFVVI